MTELKSDCELSFSRHHLVSGDLNQKCPVKACSGTELRQVAFQKRWQLPYCQPCGIRLHPKRGTFVYYNGQTQAQRNQARLRNIHFQKEFFRRRVLESKNKAETHRLGYETSEDALSWNVFCALMENNLLGRAAELLSGNRLKVENTPELYMWGSKVSLKEDSFQPLLALQAARNKFEAGIKTFPTEPDIMLIITKQAIICIEAKFTSGNPFSREKAKTRPDEKPKDAQALLGRYFDPWPEASKLMDPSKIDRSRFHTQLFRNVIFAAWMAEQMGVDWQVVNLVSSTQWAKRKTGKGAYDYQDPTPAIRHYLKDEYKKHFSFCTWESLYAVLGKNEKLKKLREYLCHKTAFLQPAFDIKPC